MGEEGKKLFSDGRDEKRESARKSDPDHDACTWNDRSGVGNGMASYKQEGTLLIAIYQSAFFWWNRSVKSINFSMKIKIFQQIFATAKISNLKKISTVNSDRSIPGN